MRYAHLWQAKFIWLHLPIANHNGNLINHLRSNSLDFGIHLSLRFCCRLWGLFDGFWWGFYQEGHQVMKGRRKIAYVLGVHWGSTRTPHGKRPTEKVQRRVHQLRMVCWGLPMRWVWNIGVESSDKEFYCQDVTSCGNYHVTTGVCARTYADMHAYIDDIYMHTYESPFGFESI